MTRLTTVPLSNIQAGDTVRFPDAEVLRVNGSQVHFRYRDRFAVLPESDTKIAVSDQRSVEGLQNIGVVVLRELPMFNLVWTAALNQMVTHGQICARAGDPEMWCALRNGTLQWWRGTDFTGASVYTFNDALIEAWSTDMWRIVED